MLRGVTLVLAGPGVPAGVRCSAPVTHEHLGRTLLDLAGLTHVEFPGTNLLRALEQAPAAPRFALSRYGQSVSVEEDGWLLVRHLVDQTDNPPPLDFAAGTEGLFELATDPSCAQDRSAEQPERAARLRAKLDGFLAATRDLGWAEGSDPGAAALAELKALGYGGGAEDE